MRTQAIPYQARDNAAWFFIFLFFFNSSFKDLRDACFVFFSRARPGKRQAVINMHPSFHKREVASPQTLGLKSSKSEEENKN